ncbi:unnamed protein product, partial [Lymnaea stagnalis]
LSSNWPTRSRSDSNGRVSSDNQELTENNNRAKRSPEGDVVPDPPSPIETGVFLTSSHRAFVPSLTEKINLTCHVDFNTVPNNTWRYLEKIVIKHQDSNHDYQPLASIDFMDNIRQSAKGAQVTGSIKGLNNSHLTIFYKHAESLQQGDYKCLVQGYQDDYNAPWLTGYSKEITLQEKEPDIETLVKEIRTDKDSIKDNRQNMAKLDGWLEKFNSYIEFLNSKADLYLEHWPDGVYSLLQTNSGCSPDMPREWNVMDVYIYTKTGRMNTDNVPAHFSGERVYDASSSYIRESFCQHEVIGHYPWPAGDYCIHPLNTMSDCPENFERGTITLFWAVTADSLNSELDMDAVPVTETIDTENKVGELTVEFCCRNDSLFNTSIALPTQSPFYLYQGQSQNCQSVKGMKYVVEEIRYDTADKGLDTSDGKTPRHALN